MVLFSSCRYDSSRKRSYEKGWEEQLSGDDSSRKTSYENRFEGRIFGDVRILQGTWLLATPLRGI